MSPPAVSVIVPTHNRVRFIERAVASVLAQSERDFELIVVDDASTDGTWEVLGKLASGDARIRLLRNEQPKGGGGARNEGIQASRGQWVAFLDDDDEWRPNKLECQLTRLTSDPGAVACACGFEQQFPSGRTRLFRAAENVSMQQLLRDNLLGGASVCVASREALERLGGFDPRLRSSQDWDLWIRLRQKGRIIVCPEPLVNYLEHDGERITNRLDSQLRGARRIYFKYRLEMDETGRRRHLSFLCYVKSRQSKRRSSFRLRYLALCLRNSTWRAALSHGVHSAPGIIRDMLA